MDARSVEAVLVELDRMRCAACGHEEIADEHEIKAEWNERVPSARRDVGHVLPSVRLAALYGALGASGSSRDTWERLRRAYDEPHRAYHTAGHVGACLRLFDEPAVRSLAADPSEVEAALWFHDAVYDPRARDNEAASARLAEESPGAAGVAHERVARVAAHVRATRDHEASSPDGQLVLDLDLSILGEVPETFARFEDEIRREYAWVPDEAYVAGRAAVLERFAARPRIYATALLRDRYEARARENLAWALRRLTTV